MSTAARLIRTLGALLIGGALVVGSPAAIATAAAPTGTHTTLPAPVLTSATIEGDTVVLLWQQSQGTVLDYAVYANSRFAFRTGVGDRAVVNLASEGLAGHEVFTVRAESAVAPDGTP